VPPGVSFLMKNDEEQLMQADDTGHVPLQQSLPRASYVAEEEFSREREAVLLPGWFCVGRTEGLQAAGAYLSADVAGESVLVVRQADGGLAGFYNLCRHRGSRLVPPSGPAAEPAASGCFAGAIRCPYHAWTYGLDGALRAAPFLPDLRRYRQQLSLHPVQVADWGGFVFVRLEPPAGGGDSLTDWLGEMPARIAGYPLAELRTGHRIVYEVAANWKVILENYNECYHCGPVHPELCDLVPAFRRGGDDLDWDAGIAHRPGAYTFTMTGTTSRQPFPGLAAAERDKHKGELVLPNLMLSLASDHVAAFTVWPRSAGQTTVVCDFLFHPAEIARPEFDPADAVQFWDLVNTQDWAICELVQDGMRSRRFTAGYLAPMEQPSADVGAHVAALLRPTNLDLPRAH
jgi:glycine betaine catabolism A